MMWRTWNKLFGWHYVYIERHYRLLPAKHCWVRRVRKTKAGERYVEIHDDWLFLDRPTDDYVITPLTWVEPVKSPPPNLKVVNK